MLPKNLDVLIFDSGSAQDMPWADISLLKTLFALSPPPPAIAIATTQPSTLCVAYFTPGEARSFILVGIEVSTR